MKCDIYEVKKHKHSKSVGMLGEEKTSVGEFEGPFDRSQGLFKCATGVIKRAFSIKRVTLMYCAHQNQRKELKLGVSLPSLVEY